MVLARLKAPQVLYQYTLRVLKKLYLQKHSFNFTWADTTHNKTVTVTVTNTTYNYLLHIMYKE